MSRQELRALYEGIAQRARETTASRPDWPCLRGCSGCCRELAGPPVFTALEWEELWEGFVALAPEVRAAVRERVRALDAAVRAPRPPDHVACPLLDPASGACLVYAHRPALCRAYGFYASRAGGSWCAEMDREVVPAARGVVWGNHDAVDAELARIGGEPVDIAAWFEAHPD